MKRFGKEYSEELLRRWDFIKECLREGLKDGEAPPMRKSSNKRTRNAEGDTGD